MPPNQSIHNNLMAAPKRNKGKEAFPQVYKIFLYSIISSSIPLSTVHDNAKGATSHALHLPVRLL